MPRRFSNSELLAWTLVGAAVGLAAGFAASEWLGPMDRRRAGEELRALTRGEPAALPPQSGSRTSRAVGVALAQDPELSDLGVTVVSAGRGTVELHGWVPTRRLRARAARIAAGASGVASILNCLLVRGEDDSAMPALNTDDQPA